MPFDGSEFTAAPAQTGPVASPGLWARLVCAARARRPAARGLPAEYRRNLPAQQEIGSIQVLQLARSLIEDNRHWIQRRYETLDGRRCAVGALRSASRLLGVRGPHNEPHGMLLSVAIGRGFTDIEKMNDHSTHAQVLSAFDTAIGRAAGRS